MAVGASYPAVITNANGDETQGDTITFTDSANQPSGDTVPFVPDTGEDVVVLETSTGDPLISGGDDTGGVTIQSADGDSRVLVHNTGIDLEGDLTSSGTAQFDAATGADEAAQLGQLTSALTVTSGTLPNTGSWVSGTAKQNPTHGGVVRQVTVFVECVFDGTANAATVAILVSPDNTTFTTVGTPGVSAAINTVGGLTQVVAVTLPAEWYIKLTIAAHATVAASIYY